MTGGETGVLVEKRNGKGKDFGDDFEAINRERMIRRLAVDAPPVLAVETLDGRRQDGRLLDVDDGPDEEVAKVLLDARSHQPIEIREIPQVVQIDERIGSEVEETVGFQHTQPVDLQGRRRIRRSRGRV